MTPEQRALRARIGAHTRWANCRDRRAATAPARKAWADRWERQADPDGILPPSERAKAAEHLKQAHMLRMALASAAARKRRNQKRARGEAA